MRKIYKTIDRENKLNIIDKYLKNTWIDLVNPNDEEIKEVVKETGVAEDLIRKMLDEEELPRIEQEDNATLIVIDTPYLADTHYKNRYTTYPLGIIICKNSYFITVSLKRINLLDDFRKNKVKDFYTSKKTRFLIQILLKTASSYLKVLNSVNVDMEAKEKILSKSTQNKHLIDLLNVEKTLVYFITSLKANDLVLEKLEKGNILDMYEEDLELLEDTRIENKQAIETSNIYREILSSVTDTYATIVSNNLNIAMKFLAGITIVFSIPTMIASFLGMNVPLGFIGDTDISFVLIIILSFIIAILVAIWLKKKDML